ncbi:ATP synthase F1 subunit gamma, partial [Candidatus Nomurabacteria bacterium]|nr:ATP synthase F1 subunit gamma [Candidatus Nomurabacteria bacterium]
LASTLATRPYAEYSWEVLTSIAENIEEKSHPLFTEREVKEGKKNILLLLITSNRGLCGAYNAQVIKKTLSLFKKEGDSAMIDVITIGRKGDIGMRRLGRNVIATFAELPDHISLLDVVPISKMIIDEYSNLNYDKVFVTYTDFISALTQKPNIKQILPISKSSLRELIDNLENTQDRQDKKEKVNYLIEGDMNTLTGMLAEKITRMQIYQMLLESNASEQSSRMVAMKNASEASGEMIDDLTLVFNKARQSNITREISEISAGMASVS